jgi:glycosyltransferase involved in cell wall biosynthesis
VPGLEVEVIANGSEPRTARSTAAARPEFARHAPRRVVAVLGAIGPHKGADVLDALARELDGSGIAIVIVGYLDRQVLPGWRVPGTLFIHGSWQDDEVPALLDAYGAKLALFPNRVPESFSYALSDVWSCGRPVLAAPYGALGERISRHGGGWLLPEGFDAPAIARRLRELFSPEGAAERARVESQLSRPDPERVPSLAAMARSLDALYERFGLDARAPAQSDPAALERLLAANLDGSLFRAELSRLADEYQQLARAHQETVASAHRFETDSRAWIAKLEADVAALTADVQREVAERRALGEANAQLAIHKAAFDLLPRVVRKWYLKKVLDARS